MTGDLLPLGKLKTLVNAAVARFKGGSDLWFNIFNI